jgi:hypothetical protein
VEGLDLEPKLFRRLADARTFIEQSPEQAVLVLSDAAWAPDLASAGFVPAFRLRRDGKDTYRRLLIVPAGAEAKTLGDLRGSSLTVVDTTPSSDAFLSQAVFSGEVEVSEWFAQTVTEVDDFAAVNAALFGTTDAALAAEYNPLLATNLDRELRVVFRSPPLPLPVVSWRAEGAGTLSATVRSGIEHAMAGLGNTAEGKALLAELGIDGFARVDSGDRGRLASLPAAAEKNFEITVPGGHVLSIEPPAPPASGSLTYRLAIELPRVNVDSGTDDKTAASDGSRK